MLALVLMVQLELLQMVMDLAVLLGAVLEDLEETQTNLMMVLEAGVLDRLAAAVEEVVPALVVLALMAK